MLQTFQGESEVDLRRYLGHPHSCEPTHGHWDNLVISSAIAKLPVRVPAHRKHLSSRCIQAFGKQKDVRIKPSSPTSPFTSIAHSPYLIKLQYDPCHTQPALGPRRQEDRLQLVLAQSQKALQDSSRGPAQIPGQADHTSNGQTPAAWLVMDQQGKEIPIINQHDGVCEMSRKTAEYLVLGFPQSTPSAPCHS